MSTKKTDTTHDTRTSETPVYPDVSPEIIAFKKIVAALSELSDYDKEGESGVRRRVVSAACALLGVKL